MGIIEKKQIICKFSSRPSQARLSPSTSNSLTRLKTLRPRSRTRKVFPQISKDSSSLESSSKTEEPSRTTTSRRNPLSISSSDSEVVCKSSSRPSLVRPSPSMLNNPTPLRTSRPRFKIRKESPQTSKDLSSPESNLRMDVLSKTTTFKRNPLSISSSDSEVVCKSSSRPSPERPSPLMSNNLTPSKTSRLRSRTKKVFPQTSKDSSSPESNSKTAALFRTTTSRRSLLSTWSSDLEEVCKSSLRPSLERPSLSTLSNLTPLRT